MQSCVSPPPTETTWCCRNLPPRPCSGVTHPRGPRSTSPCRGRRSRKPQRWRTEKVEWDHIANCPVERPHNSWTQVQEEPQCTMELCINDVKNFHATCIYCAVFKKMYSLRFLHYTIKQDQSKQTHLDMSSFSTYESRKTLSSGHLSIVWRIYLGLSVYALSQPLTQIFPADCQHFLKTKKQTGKCLLS